MAEVIRTVGVRAGMLPRIGSLSGDETEGCQRQASLHRPAAPLLIGYRVGVQS